MHITTYQKIHINPLQPQQNCITIEDIAHAQSFMTRANGHFPEFYSVAQHSIACAVEAVARQYSKRLALACLLHDGSEAYLSDITRPVKGELPEYRVIEKNMQDAIYLRFLGSLPTAEETNQIQDIDNACLYYEFDYYMGEKLLSQPPHLASRPVFETLPFADVEQQFLSVYKELSATAI